MPEQDAIRVLVEPPAAEVRTPSRSSVRRWARDIVRIPGLISLSRLVFAALFPMTVGQHPGWALAVLAVAGASDVLDGWYARRFHQQTAAGAMLDAFTDKVFVLSVVVTLLVAGSMAPIELVLLGTRDIGEAALVVRLGLTRRRALTRAHAANASGKIATLLQYGAIVAIILESGQRDVWIGAAALAGVLASISYWHREVDRAEERRATEGPSPKELEPRHT